jgi:hypothetical protein
LLCFLTASVRHSAWLMHCSTNSSLLLRSKLEKKELQHWNLLKQRLVITEVKSTFALILPTEVQMPLHM